jgi:protein involved in polysaccharide export with SLBB domain
MTNPVVTVIVVEASGATAYVMGEVNHPGAVTLQGGQLTVLQAPAIAGGLKDFATPRTSGFFSARVGSEDHHLQLQRRDPRRRTAYLKPARSSC